MDTDQKVIASAAFLVIANGYLLAEKRQRRKRRWWIRSLYKRGGRYGGSNATPDLTGELSVKYEYFCRMSATDFEFLLNKIGPRITKTDTRFRKAIPHNERLAVTLRFLASGDSFKRLSLLFKISNQVISNIVHEVCNALIEELQDQIKKPTTASEWQMLEDGFREQWNFPHCVGAIVGKHILLQSPLSRESEFHNHKGTYSIILMAAVDADYCFTYTDIELHGMLSDDSVFKNCALSKEMNDIKITLPPDKPLPSGTFPVPHVFVTDDAFPLTTHIMKPFAGTRKNENKERAYNYRLSRARRVVDNALGLMVSVFRVFRKPMLFQPDKATNITMTCVLLHNFLRRSTTSASKYAPPGTFDTEDEGTVTEGSWRRDQKNISSMLPLCKQRRKMGEEPKRIRDEFADYFAGVGKLPWQDSFC